jgi:8-oxo-dGTP diphosphatase
MKKVHVVAGILQVENQFLCVQRGPNKYSYIHEKWEFPGGKLEEGESAETALVRELKEELSLNVHSLRYLLTVHHEYPDFIIEMDAYLCKSDSSWCELTEHIEAKWLRPDQMDALDWAAADLPIVEALKNV